MKFSFESDMKKGECSRCPICKCQHSQNGGIWYCGITSTVVTEIFDVDPADCPLEEEQGLTWHPYPAEVPSDDVGECLVSVDSKAIGLFVTNSQWQGEDEGGWLGCFDYMVKAWAELPKPYKEEV